MSLMKIKNRSGPSTDPCGTPHIMSDISESTPSKYTYCFLLDNVVAISFFLCFFCCYMLMFIPTLCMLLFSYINFLLYFMFSHNSFTSVYRLVRV